jgi:hypothetical protein
LEDVCGMQNTVVNLFMGLGMIVAVSLIKLKNTWALILKNCKL